MKRNLIILSTPTNFNVREHLPPRQVIYTDPVEYDTATLGTGTDLANMAVALTEAFFVSANWDWLKNEGITEALLSSREILSGLSDDDRAALRRNILGVRSMIANKKFAE